MISKRIIRENTNATTYSRGMDIYYNNDVMEYSLEEAEADHIRAKVKGSGRNKYYVSITYDTTEDFIEEVACECPAFRSYNGLCKHCVAVLLEYMNHKERQKAIEKVYSKKQEAIGKLQAMKGIKERKTAAEQKTEATSPAIKQLLSDYRNQATLLIQQNEAYGGVRLEPYFTCDKENILLEFKIGFKQMYVLKDVFAFNAAMESGSNVSYGQKLEFVHKIDAFEKSSRPVVEFICNWAQRNKKHYMQYGYSYYSGSYTQAKLRTVPLSANELIEALEICGDRPITANVNLTGEMEWKLSEEELPREMEISKKGDGIQVKINYLFGYQCSMGNIYFYEGRIYIVPQKKIEPISDFLKTMACISNRTVYIQKEDIPVFCRGLLPTLEKYFTCVRNNFDERDYGIVPASFEIYLDAPQKDFITCKVLAVYGESKFNIYDEADNTAIRDRLKEAETGRIISNFFNAFDDKEKLMVLGEAEDRIYEFLLTGMARLQEIGEVYISEALRRLKIITAPRVVVGVSMNGNVMELRMTSEDMPREELLEILSKYNRRKKFYRLKNGDFVNVVGEELETLLELKQGMGLSDAQLRREQIEIPRYRALYLDAELKGNKSLGVIKDKEFKALIRNMKTVEDNDFDVPSALEKILREYQKRGYLWLKTLKNNGFGGILADDMGLGKTLQVICFLLSEYLDAAPQENKRALIICPASLVYNWEKELNRFAPELPVKLITGISARRQELLQQIRSQDILVTSYDLLKRDMEYYKEVEFYCEIIDEAQYIKNYNTQAARAVKEIRAGFKLALTGTPIENRLSELWSIFDYLMPGFLYTYQKFHDEFELPIVQNQEEAAIKRLQKMITPFILRRLKKEVLTDLPDKLEECIYSSMEGEQQKLYDAHVKKLQILLSKQSEEEFKSSKIQILSELTKLRQICCDPALLFEDYHSGSAKVEVCMDLIRNAIDGGHKILLFSQFTSMFDILKKQLQKEGIRFYCLTGSTSKENRAKMVEDFNKDDTPVFCISLKAGGTGLNLTAADIVIHYDPWWNIAVQNQATDRAHRIGQRNVVNEYKLVVKGTIEENIIKIQDMKKELAEQVLSGEGMSVGSFTREELLSLLD